MAIRVKHRVYVHTFGDTDEKLQKFTPDPELMEVLTDEVEKQSHSDLSIAPTSTDTLPFGDIAAVKGMYLEMQAACKVRINGSLDDIDLTPVKGVAGANTTTPAKLFLEAPLTAVTVENTHATDPLIGQVVFWGDPTP